MVIYSILTSQIVLKDCNHLYTNLVTSILLWTDKSVKIDGKWIKTGKVDRNWLKQNFH